MPGLAGPASRGQCSAAQKNEEVGRLGGNRCVAGNQMHHSAQQGPATQTRQEGDEMARGGGGCDQTRQEGGKRVRLLWLPPKASCAAAGGAQRQLRCWWGRLRRRPAAVWGACRSSLLSGCSGAAPEQLLRWAAIRGRHRSSCQRRICSAVGGGKQYGGVGAERQPSACVGTCSDSATPQNHIGLTNFPCPVHR